MLAPRCVRWGLRLVHTKPVVKDVLIVGGGPAGLSLLRGLQQSPVAHNLDVALVDGQPLASNMGTWAAKHAPELDTEFDNRVISLTPKNINHLEKIGVWDNVLTERTMPYDEMRVWDGESGAAIDFDGWGAESGLVATMIETANLQQALYRTVVNNAKPTQLSETMQPARLEDSEASEPTSGSTSAPSFIKEAKVESIMRSTDTQWPIVTLSTGERIMARLLVGADGQQSPVRIFSNIESRGWDYQRFGVVATLHLEYDNMRAIAYQRFLRTGPLAILPLPDGNATMVWSTTPERAQWLRKLAPAAVSAMVNAGTRLEMADIDYLHQMDPENTEGIIEEVQWRLDQRSPEQQEQDDDGSVPVLVESVAEGSVAAFPLRMRHADSYIGDRVALVGDAAHATHPLTGQGLNMGQRDVQSLVSAIENAVDRGLDIGSQLALEPYPRACYLPNHIILGVNDKFHKLYSTDFAPLVALRSLGLRAVNSLPFIKDFAMKQAQ